MSIKITSYIWDHSTHSGSDLLMLLAIADHANDQGVCWPSLPTLARKCRVSKRQAINIIHRLEKEGDLLIKRGVGRGHISIYTIKGATEFTFCKKGEAEFTNSGGKGEVEFTNAAVKGEAEFTNSGGKGEVEFTNAKTIKGEIQYLKGEIAISPDPSLEPSEEKTKDLNPPPLNPPQGGKRTRKVKQASQGAQEILAHLITLTGRPYTNADDIQSCLTRGQTVAQCLLVLDWWKACKVQRDPEQDQYFDNETPFRVKKFDKYHAAAVVWNQQGRPDYGLKHGTTSTHSPTDEEICAP